MKKKRKGYILILWETQNLESGLSNTANGCLPKIAQCSMIMTHELMALSRQIPWAGLPEFQPGRGSTQHMWCKPMGCAVCVLVRSDRLICRSDLADQQCHSSLKKTASYAMARICCQSTTDSRHHIADATPCPVSDMGRTKHLSLINTKPQQEKLRYRTEASAALTQRIKHTVD